MVTDFVITKVGGRDDRGHWYSHTEYDHLGNGLNVQITRSPVYQGSCNQHYYDKQVLALNPSLAKEAKACVTLN